MKEEFYLKPAQIFFEDAEVFTLAGNYEQPVIEEHLRRYFSQNKAKGRMSDFLKPDKDQPRKNAYIENAIYEDNQYATRLMNSLEEIYNSRRELKSTDKEKFSKTSLVKSAPVIAMLKEAIKVHGETSIRHSFIAYSDAVLYGNVEPKKFLPYFFSQQEGEYGVIEHYLDYFNSHYSVNSK